FEENPLVVSGSFSHVLDASASNGGASVSTQEYRWTLNGTQLPETSAVFTLTQDTPGLLRGTGRTNTLVFEYRCGNPLQSARQSLNITYR
ncbi:MAG: hypothetical protein AAFV29_24215, partial [Myxococcota bacterium]